MPLDLAASTKRLEEVRVQLDSARQALWEKMRQTHPDLLQQVEELQAKEAELRTELLTAFNDDRTQLFQEPSHGLD